MRKLTALALLLPSLSLADIDCTKTEILKGKTDEFTPHTSYSIDIYKKETSFLESESASIDLVVGKKFGASILKLTASFFYKQGVASWLHYNSANTNRATTLPLLNSSRQVLTCRDGCIFSEQISFELPFDEIESAASGKDVKVKISNKKGWGSEPVLTISEPDANKLVCTIKKLKSDGAIQSLGQQENNLRQP